MVESLMAFNLVDDVARAVEKGRPLPPSLPVGCAGGIAAWTEWEYLRRQGFALPALTVRSTTRPLVVSAVASPSPPISDSNSAALFECCGLPDDTTGTPWLLFLQRFRSAAERSGVPRLLANGLAAALHELADNAILHSQFPQTAVVGYAQTGSGIEYVVADAGIGVLQSLRTSPRYQSLADDQEALQQAVVAGASSREDRVAGAGHGFERVLLPLKHLAGEVRLRSGTGCLTVTSVGAANRGIVTTRPEFRGTLAAARISSKVGAGG